MTTREEFNLLIVEHRVVPVMRELFADAETPVGIYRKLAQGVPGSFLLESAEQGGIWSRYSFIGVSSFGVLTQVGDFPHWMDYGLSEERAFGSVMRAGPLDGVGPLDVTGKLWERWTTPRIPGHPPLTGGLVGFLGWDAVRQIEKLPNGPPRDFDIPGQAFSFVRELVVMDHRTGSVLLIVSALNDGVETPDELWDRATQSLNSLQSRLAGTSEPSVAEVNFRVEPTPEHCVEAHSYFDAVEAGKRFIREGDVFQVVLSQRFDHEVTADSIDVYRVLRALNPSPYMYLLTLAVPNGEPYWVVGSSPEALVKVSEGRAYMHPIAGSRPRGKTPERDAELAAALLQDEKEKSEHLMLVDLARNDLAKVCVPGSVEVTEFMQVERFSHIMHLVSSVEGNLVPDAGPIDVIKATFPAGTLSGAPKPRALEIIDEIEPAARGLYGGVVGYIDFAGELDLAIAIRTATISRGVARVQAGAGIVAESDPESEYNESRNKAAAPLRAVAVANGMRRVRP